MDVTLIRIENVSKVFGARRALDGVSLEIRRGETLALVGRNGAGKSTLLSVILGLVRPTAGDVLVRGISVRRDGRHARAAIGSILGTAFYEYLSGWENLRILTRYSGVAAPAATLREMVHAVGLDASIHRPVRGYSHGMKRRLAFAQALVPTPEILLLDEPEEALDPEGADTIRALIDRLHRERGLTVIVASHRLESLERTCDRVALLDDGRLVFAGSWDALLDSRPRLRLELDDRAAAMPIVHAFGADMTGDVLTLDAGADVADLVTALVRGGIRVRAVEALRPTLEDLVRAAPRAKSVPTPWTAAVDETPHALVRPMPRGRVRVFVAQLRGELRKLWARPRTYLGFGGALACELVLTLLTEVPSVRAHVTRELWRTRIAREGLSGPTIAVHVTGETMAVVGALFLALVAGDIVAKEAEDGTLRTIFARPVGRASVLFQKLLACAVYTIALTLFVGATSLALALLFAGRGTLVAIALPESIMGVLGFPLALRRYALAMPMLAGSSWTVAMLALTLSCFDMKPGAATVLALVVLLTDELVRLQPAFVTLAPYCLATRLLTWRQVFSHTIPWLRIQRNYTDLLRLDLVLTGIAWWAFRRRELTG